MKNIYCYYLYNLLTERSLWKQKLLICSSVVLASTPALSQITPDNTLGAESSRLTPNVLINGAASDRIDSGVTRGSNLFHSFSDFNIDDGQRVYFGNPNGIENILTRVTGGNASSILGTLGVDGGANLFLLNPNGIIFGQNASLDLRGSFVGTTANAIGFGEQGFFSATDTTAPPLLTVNPSALLFTQLQAPAGITNQSIAPAGVNPNGVQTTGLRVPDGKSLLLVGGNVNLDGGRLRAYGGQVELGGLTSLGSVALQADGNNLRLGFPDNVTRADVSLTNSASVFVEAGGGGSIAINARNLEVSGGSILSAGIGQGLGSVDTVAGDITLDATGEIKVVGETSLIYNRVRSQAQGKGGNLIVNTRELQILDGAQVNTGTLGAGKGGNLTVTATDSVQVNGTSADGTVSSFLSSQSQSGATGNAGGLTINTRELLVQDGGQASTSTFSVGNGGNLTVNATGRVQVNGTSADGTVSSFLGSRSQSGATGNAGNLTINTGELLVEDGAFVSASTSGAGKGGNLTVTAESVRVSNAYLLAQANRNATSNAGDLTIKTGTLLVQDGGGVSASTYGRGNGGALVVDASKKVEVVGTSADGIRSGLFSQQNTEDATGVAGNLTIDTPVLLVKDGAIVSANTFGAGNGGNLTVNASDSVEVTGTIPNGKSGSRVTANTEGTGNAGNLTINTRRLMVKDAQVATGTLGIGNAGNLTVNASESIDLSGVIFGDTDDYPAGLFASVNSQGTGRGGKLTVETGRLSISNGAKVQVATFGTADAGDLFIRASDIDIFETPRSRYTYFAGGIYAGVQQTREATEPPKGYGGSVTIETNRLRVRDGGTVTTSTEGEGNAGTLKIRATEFVEVFGRSPTELFNSEISAATTPESTGNGGSLSIDTEKLIVRDRGMVTVRNERQGGTNRAGNLEINASSINLDKGIITATTNSGNGGNATITLKNLLLLRNNSTISTTAGTAQQGGDGGNITITTPFIVAVPSENSDISANAFSGRGGNISIDAESIFGIQARSLPTLYSDITASSQLGVSGQISITEPNVQPTQGLVELPASVLDASDQIAQTCPNGATANRSLGEFVVTGRGSLPPNPFEALAGTTSLSPLASIDGEPNTNLPKTSSTAAIPPNSPTAIIEASGWVKTVDGKIALVASAPQATPNATTVQATCPVPK